MPFFARPRTPRRGGVETLPGSAPSRKPGDGGHGKKRPPSRIRQPDEPETLVEGLRPLVLRVHDRRVNRERFADARDAAERIRQKGRPQASPAEAPVHGQTTEQRRRDGIARQPPRRLLRQGAARDARGAQRVEPRRFGASVRNGDENPRHPASSVLRRPLADVPVEGFGAAIEPRPVMPPLQRLDGEGHTPGVFAIRRSRVANASRSAAFGSGGSTRAS